MKRCQATKQQFPVSQPNKFSSFEFGLNYQPVTNGIRSRSKSHHCSLRDVEKFQPSVNFQLFNCCRIHGANSLAFSEKRLSFQTTYTSSHSVALSPHFLQIYTNFWSTKGDKELTKLNTYRCAKNWVLESSSCVDNRPVPPYN